MNDETSNSTPVQVLLISYGLVLSAFETLKLIEGNPNVSAAMNLLDKELSRMEEAQNAMAGNQPTQMELFQ